jgi:hypothetical protein
MLGAVLFLLTEKSECQFNCLQKLFGVFVITEGEDAGPWGSAIVKTEEPCCCRKGLKWLGCGWCHNPEIMYEVVPKGVKLESCKGWGSHSGIVEG